MIISLLLVAVVLGIASQEGGSVSDNYGWTEGDIWEMPLRKEAERRRAYTQSENEEQAWLDIYSDPNCMNDTPSIKMAFTSKKSQLEGDNKMLGCYTASHLTFPSSIFSSFKLLKDGGFELFVNHKCEGASASLNKAVYNELIANQCFRTKIWDGVVVGTKFPRAVTPDGVKLQKDWETYVVDGEQPIKMARGKAKAMEKEQQMLQKQKQFRQNLQSKLQKRTRTEMTEPENEDLYKIPEAKSEDEYEQQQMELDKDGRNPSMFENQQMQEAVLVSQ